MYLHVWLLLTLLSVFIYFILNKKPLVSIPILLLLVDNNTIIIQKIISLNLFRKSMFHGRERPCKHSYGASETFGHQLSLVFTSKFIVLKYFYRSVFQVLTICFSTIIREDFFGTQRERGKQRLKIKKEIRKKKYV